MLHVVCLFSYLERKDKNILINNKQKMKTNLAEKYLSYIFCTLTTRCFAGLTKASFFQPQNKHFYTFHL